MSKYPKRGGDCEYTMDCPWGVDRWCDRPEENKCEIQKMDEAKTESAKTSTKEDALRRLVKLGDMMGDGLHLEPGGGWITKEYRRAMKQAGMMPTKPRDTTGIDEYMAKRVTEEKCNCGGTLEQTRKGSFRAKCIVCGAKWQLGGRKQ